MIYLDHHATTPCLNEVMQAMNQFHTIDYANIGSQHALGKEAKNKFELLEKAIFEQMGHSPEKMIYTSGATESINLAHMGLLEHCLNNDLQIISSKIEHQATLNVLTAMHAKGVKVSLLNVNQCGHFDIDQLKTLLQHRKTALLSFILSNNEVGSIQDFQACIKLAKEYGAWVHMDISQSVCTQRDFSDFSEVDLLSLSGHKIYGPKGIGGLIINQTSSKRVPLKAILYGGHASTQALRPGTHSTALAAGLCVALQACFRDAKDRRQHFLKLKTLFLKQLEHRLEGWQLNGDPNGLSHNIHLGFFDVPYSVVEHLKKIAVSSGSTCSTDSKKMSHVLEAMGFSDQYAQSSIRIGLGLNNCENDMYLAVEDIAETVERIRQKTKL